MAAGDQGMKHGHVPLNGGHGLSNNACQAPAAVKIGVTLLFSGSLPHAGAAFTPQSASQAVATRQTDEKSRRIAQ